ncbi:flagellar protofilament ribbon protein-like protein [Novymonas esmeraldas]|uniref:Flagellar protofilament ribbon protein-like protein n=1 Tax=Novymonas esmeraldas TaxID=1808958 RepID=A0AAW0ELS6_9TRYP
MESAAQTQGGFSATNSRGAADGKGMSNIATDPNNTKTKKQLFMSQRAERLKDPKVRKMGIDREALDAQVREKEALRRLEKDRDDYHDRQALLMDRHACALQQEVNAIRAAREKELQDYRQTFQKKELGREWDLNDPAARRKELPARVGDNDPRNGPSSLQKFDGEDLDYAARRAAQQQQQRQWAQQQVNEKLAKKWMEQERDRAFDDRNEEVNYRLYEIEQKVAEQRRLMEKNGADFNRALAEQQRREAVRAKEENTRLGLAEMAYQMDSDFLNEREGVVGELGATVKAERFKGISEKQKTLLRAGQDEQLRELRRRRLLEVEENKQWSQQEHMQLRMANALDRQRERERRAERERLAETHKMQAQAATQRKAELDELYTNAVDEDYFKYWDRCL